MGFWEAFIETLHWLATSAGWSGIFVLVSFGVVALVLLVLICWGLYIAVDSWFLPVWQAPGEVTGKEHSPQHLQLMPITTGKVTMLQPVIIPESWHVYVSADKGDGGMSVNQEYYDSADTGQDVTVHYVLGRISQRMYVKNLS